MGRAYLRVDPQLYERKVIQQGYSLALFAAFVGALCLAEHQPTRGRFRDERVLRALLGPVAARHVPELITRGDLVEDDGQLYVDGWNEWQEGDWKVGERVARIRDRQRGVTAKTVTRVTPATVTPDSVPTVYTPSDGRRQSVIDSAGGRPKAVGDSPPPPAERGRRKDETNLRAVGKAPRQTGTNARANGTSVRQERQAAKTGPTALGDVLREAARRQDDPSDPSWVREPAAVVKP